MWPNTKETQELLDRAKLGEPTAVEALLDRHRDALRRMVGLRLDPMLARRVDASDIVQDVLIEASRRLSDYLKDPRMPFHLWLRHLARDQMIDAHRRHRLAQRRSLDREQPIRPAVSDDDSSDMLAHVLAPDQTPATAALRQELARKLGLAMTHLAEDDREIIIMRHQEQLANQDVAASLGVSEAAASMRYLRALRRLRKMLTENGGDSDLNAGT